MPTFGRTAHALLALDRARRLHEPEIGRRHGHLSTTEGLRWGGEQVFGVASRSKNVGGTRAARGHSAEPAVLSRRGMEVLMATGEVLCSRAIIHPRQIAARDGWCSNGAR